MKSLIRLSIILGWGMITACTGVMTPSTTPTPIQPTAVQQNTVQPTEHTETPTITPAPLTETPTAIASPTLAPTNPPLSLSTLTGKIVYSYEGDIYTLDLDAMHNEGAEPTRLTYEPADDFDPVWSPDGTQIAFRSHRDGNEEVYVMNADGSNQRNLTNAPRGDYSPAWSPDGQWIAFMSDRDGRPNIWVVRPDGTDFRQVTDIPGISEYPSWSPDSQRIVFHCTFGKIQQNGSGDFEICIVNANGSGLIQLTDTPGANKLPAWSPDGTKIAFQSDRAGWPTLPDYTPPGYDADDFGDYEIFVMNVDGSEQTNLTNNPREDDTFVAWSRDGFLIFTRYGCLTVMSPTDLSEAQISKGSCAEADSGHFPDWFQEGK